MGPGEQGRRAVIALVTPGIGDGPLNVVLDEVHRDFRTIEPGTLAQMDGETLRVGSLASVQASNQPRDQFGALIPGLTDYAVTVVVDGSGADASLNGIAAETDALRIDVTVTHPAISPLTLSGFRTRYPP